MDQWAARTGQTDQRLLDFETYQNDLYLNHCVRTVDSLIKGRSFLPEEVDQAVDFLWQFEDSFSKGSMDKIVRELKEHPGYSVFMELGTGTVYERWVPAALESTSPYTAGFTWEK